MKLHDSAFFPLFLLPYGQHEKRYQLYRLVFTAIGVHLPEKYIVSKMFLLNENHPLHNQTLHISGTFIEPEK